MPLVNCLPAASPISLAAVKSIAIFSRRFFETSLFQPSTNFLPASSPFFRNNCLFLSMFSLNISGIFSNSPLSIATTTFPKALKLFKVPSKKIFAASHKPVKIVFIRCTAILTSSASLYTSIKLLAISVNQTIASEASLYISVFSFFTNVPVPPNTCAPNVWKRAISSPSSF